MGVRFSNDEVRDITEADVKVDCSESKSIKNILTDSREVVEPQSLFVGLSGAKHRGVRFAEEAYEKGCRHFVVARSDSRSFPRKLLKRDVAVFLVRDAEHAYQALARAYIRSLPGIKVAVTGSAGKTFAKELLAHLCRKVSKKVFASAANENNHIGVPKNVLSIESLCDVYIFECAMNHPGELRRLSWVLEPDLTLITNVLPAHIGFLKSMEAIARAKFELFAFQASGGVAFLNRELERHLKLAEHEPPKRVEFFETGKLSVSAATKSFADGKVLVADEVTGTTITIPLMPSFLLDNVEGVFSVANELGIGRGSALKSLEDFCLPPRRFEIVRREPMVVDDAYNANPVSTYKSIESLLSLTKGEADTHLVLGDMFELGSMSGRYHAELADQLGQLFATTSGLASKEKLHLYFVGKHMKITYKAIRWPQKTYFSRNDPDLVADALVRHVKSDSIVYFKASNGMDFKKIVEAFLCSTT